MDSSRSSAAPVVFFIHCFIIIFIVIVCISILGSSFNTLKCAFGSHIYSSFGDSAHKDGCFHIVYLWFSFSSEINSHNFFQQRKKNSVQHLHFLIFVVANLMLPNRTNASHTCQTQNLYAQRYVEMSCDWSPLKWKRDSSTSIMCAWKCSTTTTTIISIWERFYAIPSIVIVWYALRLSTRPRWSVHGTIVSAR